MSSFVPKVYWQLLLTLFIVYISQIQAKDDVLTLNIPRSLTACPQKLELNHIIASYSHDDKDNNYELHIKVREKWRMRVISSASNICYWSLRFLSITSCSDGSLSTWSYNLLPACSLKYCWCTVWHSLLFSHHYMFNLDTRKSKCHNPQFINYGLPIQYLVLQNFVTGKYLIVPYVWELS